MERTAALAQQRERSETGGQLTRRPPNSAGLTLATLMEQTKLRWRAQEISKEQTKSDLHDWATLVAKFGLDVFRDALGELRTDPDQEFFPQPAAIARRCVEVAKRKKQEEAARREPLGPCEICHGVRMVIRDKAGNTWHDSGQGERIAHWCECVLARRRKEQMAAAKQMQMAGTR